MSGIGAIKYVPLIALGVAACASTATSSNEPADRCESTDCFNQQQIRNFEVIDNTTLVVYVGNQSCPFRVDFIGTACDLTFLPGGRLVFRPDFLRAQRETDLGLMRICANDSNVGIQERPFTQAGGASELDPRIDCRIRDIESLTDDELLELYVDHQLAAPPPPIPTEELKVPEDAGEPSEAQEGTAAAGNTAAAELETPPAN